MKNICASHPSISTEQELHILWRQTLHRRLISIDGRINHVRLLLLQQDHTTLDGILDTQASNGARASLTDTMATICALPLCCGVPPWVDDEDLRGFSEIESYTTCFQRNEEALDVHIAHEVVDRSLSLCGCHGTIKHDSGDTSTTKTPFHKLEHGCELTENYRFAGHVLGSKFVEIMNQSLDLGAGSPVLHLNSVDDRGFLNHLFVLFDVRLLEVDGEGDVALRTVGVFWKGLASETAQRQSEHIPEEFK